MKLNLRALALALVALTLEPATVRADPLGDAQAAYEKLQYAVSFRIWQGLAERGNAEAQTSLGRMYFLGEGIPRDYPKALYWAEKAARQGNAEAQWRAGGIYKYGFVGTPDSNKALPYFRTSANQNFRPALYELGKMYLYGDAVPKDYTMALDLLRRAAEKGDVGATYCLATMYETGLGVPVDYVRAAQLYRSAAEVGDGPAQYRLGRFYGLGLGVKVDYKESYFWLELAARDDVKRTRDAAIHDRDNGAALHLTAGEIAEVKARAMRWIARKPAGY